MSLRGDKGLQYITQLYEARSNGAWDEVSELARKVEKHAPTRKTLTLAARAGATINRTKDGFSIAEAQYGALLAASLEHEEQHRDILDGLITRAALYYGTGQQELALRQIPETLHRSPPPNGAKGENAWFGVCVMQGTLLRGLALEALGNLVEAGNTYRSIIAFVSRVVGLRSKYAELCRWTEDLLSHLCIFFAMDVEGKPLQLGEAMAAFHLLSRFLDDQAWRPLGTRPSFAGHRPRFVWRAFYEALSRIVAEGLVYHPSPVQRDHDTSEHRGLLEEDDFIASRVQQRADLRRVEVNYESLLLQDMIFPKANETNEEVKGWVELVMSNFRTLCGPTWTDVELGAGGKAAVGRTTLDILYRAATKTFHSTQILRHLFHVHCFLGEFDLAYKALDSYIEIITKGKARVEKSGQAGLDLDDDDTAVRLGAEAIRVACKFAPDTTTDKILSIGESMQKWLEKVSSDTIISNNGEPGASPNSDNFNASPSRLSPKVVALAYRAIGLCQANYARKTFNPSIRVEMQSQAIDNFQQSLELSENDSVSLETLYALALVLAERRDIDGAIHFVKRALSRPQEGGVSATTDGFAPGGEDISTEDDDAFLKERRLLPCWHLLVLLLCAREDFDVASTSCDAAFQQFGDATTMFGQAGDAAASKASLHQTLTSSSGLVDRMDAFERQMLLEIKLTQVALLEVAHGPESAVNACNQLLALYARLFGKVDFTTTRAPKFSSMQLPRNVLRGKVRRNKAKLGFMDGFRVKGLQPRAYAPVPFPETGAALASRPSTKSGSDPKSLYDKRNMVASYEKLNHRFSGIDGTFQDIELQHSGSLRPSAFGSIRSTKNDHQEPRGLDHINENAYYDPDESINSTSPNQSRSIELPPRVDSLTMRTLDNGSHHQNGDMQTNSLTDLSLPADYNVQHVPQHASTGEYVIPAPQFVKLQERRQKVSLLVKIWLFTAGTYARAAMYDDARQSIDEANKLVTALETEVAKQGSSLRNFQDEGWGGGQSIEDLWSDVYTERGNLYRTQGQPHDALLQFEQALGHSPNHPRATVELSSILLDIYSQVIPSEKPDPASNSLNAAGIAMSAHPSAQIPAVQESEQEKAQTVAAATRMPEPLPPELYRLIARDRAYGLLSSLTKLGSSWDSSEAWFVLARAYEESGQLEEAKRALWWTVELEDTKPVRPWRDVSPGGYVL